MTDPHDFDDLTAKRVDLSAWRPLLRYLRPYRAATVALIAAGTVVALLDSSFAILMRGAIDRAVATRSFAATVPYLAVYVLFGLLLGAGIRVFIRAAGRLRTGVSHDIRRDGFARLQELSYSFFDRHSVGWLMARMTSDCDRLSNIFAWGILDVAWGATLLVFVTVVMIVIHVKLALVVLAIVPLVAWVSAVFRRRILASARLVRKTNSRITASYNEGIMGVTTSKAFVRESAELSDFRGLSTEMYGASVRNALQSALLLPIILTLGSIATAAVLADGGFGLKAATISVGTLVLFLSYSRLFFEPIQQLANRFAEMQMAQASAERILGLIQTEPEIRDSAEVRAALAANGAAPAPGRARDGGPDRIGAIEFRGVGFAYREGPMVIRDFDLVVAPGETIALVGSTGAGKTTLVNLLCRFYEPTRGEILIDGVDYRRRSLAWLQGNLGIVLQEPHLFSGTVGDNIRYGRLDATDAEVREAASLAGAHEFIEEMRDGYATEVGEGGVRLSTGQKQLLSFARAILKRPRILVMDEATSSVDTETEKRIQVALRRVLEGRTSFVIAHRLSTIRGASRILVVEDGRIVEQGSHQDLMKVRGRYSELYRQQSLADAARTWTEPSSSA
jgi:ATP-binding cassette subfamily B protein